jgi:hypothetical protein
MHPHVVQPVDVRLERVEDRHRFTVGDRYDQVTARANVVQDVDGGRGGWCVQEPRFCLAAHVKPVIGRGR